MKLFTVGGVTYHLMSSDLLLASLVRILLKINLEEDQHKLKLTYIVATKRVGCLDRFIRSNMNR